MSDPQYPAGPWQEIKRITWYRMLRQFRKRRDKRFPSPVIVEFDLQNGAANERIRSLLEAPGPCMISRFGGVEMRAVTNFQSIHSPAAIHRRIREYLNGERDPWWWDDRTKREMLRQAGFFPVDPDHLDRFARLFMQDSPEVDLLGSWSPEEYRMPVSPRLVRVPLIELEPYLHENPWSEALAGQRVLVVHPFDRSIRSQYARRKELYRDPKVLPEFDLQTLQAVQSLGGQCSRFRDWFEALDWMKEQMSCMDFDVALIGAGAYGMALAAFVKRDLGRKAVHLGGATQILFGIKGRRWDDRPGYFDRLYNGAWVRPLDEETPATAGKVEGGCYW